MIVDASVAFKWFVAERGSDDAHAVLRCAEPLTAPDLIVTEVAAALGKAVAAGALDAGDAMASLERLPSLFVELAPAAPLVQRALALSLQLKQPVQACHYIALAEARAQVLLTADRMLFRSATGSRLERHLRLL